MLVLKKHQKGALRACKHAASASVPCAQRDRSFQDHSEAVSSFVRKWLPWTTRVCDSFFPRKILKCLRSPLLVWV